MHARNWLLVVAWLLTLGGVGAVTYLSSPSSAVELHADTSAKAARENLAPSKAPPGNELERLKNSIAALEDRLERTEAALIRLSSTLETLSGVQAGSERGNGENSASKRKPLTTEQIEQINRRQREKDAERLNDNFQLQSVDSTWSLQATALIAERLNNNQELPGVELITNECRESLCRIEVVVADAEQKLQFEEKLPLLIGEILPRTTMFDEPQPDGSIRSIIYLGKDNG